MHRACFCRQTTACWIHGQLQMAQHASAVALTSERVCCEYWAGISNHQLLVGAPVVASRRTGLCLQVICDGGRNEMEVPRMVWRCREGVCTFARRIDANRIVRSERDCCGNLLVGHDSHVRATKATRPHLVVSRAARQLLACACCMAGRD